MRPAPPHDPDPLARLDRYKRMPGAGLADVSPLSAAMLDLWDRQLRRRQDKLARVADVWCRLVPAPLLDRTALKTFARGRLTVTVDSAPHLYELRQVMLAGLEDQLLAACRGAGLRKIALVRGTWDDGDFRAD